MRKVILTMLFMLIPTMAFAQPACRPGRDVLLNAKIQDVVIAMDKNGKQYVRVIVNEQRTLQGISYEVGVPVMAFGSHVKEAKSLTKGQTLKAVCDRHEVKGKVSYTILKIVR
ncbi:MAG: hypothetical protein JRJ29_23135 [Deltaproteobacteria bacterium]|nr:hypothetical protein [Deltaproteobacteria bacterium]